MVLVIKFYYFTYYGFPNTIEEAPALYGLKSVLLIKFPYICGLFIDSQFYSMGLFSWFCYNTTLL